jgi:hypothetical protein
VVLFVGACKAEPEVIEKEVTREVMVQVTKEVEVEVTKKVEVEVTRVVEKEVTVEVEVVATPAAEVPFAALWVSSGHAKTDAEAFNHWNEDDPAVIPISCARCHSTYGYRDYVGADGTAAGVVDNDAEIGSVITCVACHNDATLELSSVTFPSGAEVTGLGREARCMVCHQGRASTVSVNNALEEAGLGDDESSEDLGFINIHYYAAGATLYGGVTMGGYQYEGQTYDAKFSHVAGIDTCVGCHDPHTLEIRLDVCSTCHTNVTEQENLKDVRWMGSLVDYDGDDDVKEGVYYEIEGLRDALYGAIQAYAKDAGTAIVYESHAYPYFFIDTDGNGKVDEGEAAFPNRYNAWTPRLVRAAYNYQASLKDPGAFAHGGKYIIQLLYDSIEDLDAALVEGLHRNDAGHFAGSKEPFRHWDEDGKVPARCSRCHSATGLPTLLKEGVTTSQPLSNGFLCTTCHDSLPEFTRRVVEEVPFPSGAVIDSGDPGTNLCISCHQGRESTTSVDRLIAGAEVDDDTQSDKLRFLNSHYYPAGATLFGTEAKGAYEYAGKEYAGRYVMLDTFSNCTQCHDTHLLEVKVETCAGCHADVKSEEDLHTIRTSKTDYDGDGDAEEGIAEEVATLHEALYEAMQAYAADVVGTGIVYDAHRYPYYFTEDGERYATWTPRLLRAAYNYQYVAKDPGAFAHNNPYIIQVLYDGLEDLGTAVTVDMAGMVRPEGE